MQTIRKASLFGIISRSCGAFRRAEEQWCLLISADVGSSHVWPKAPPDNRERVRKKNWSQDQTQWRSRFVSLLSLLLNHVAALQLLRGIRLVGLLWRAEPSGSSHGNKSHSMGTITICLKGNRALSNISYAGGASKNIGRKERKKEKKEAQFSSMLVSSLLSINLPALICPPY